MIPSIGRYATDIVAGIDYSICSPAICVIPPYLIDSVIVPFAHCHFHYLTNSPKAIVSKANIHGELFGSWKSDEERYETIAEWAIRVLKSYKIQSIGLEDYAFSKRLGRITQMAENCGLLKYHLHLNHISYNLFAPTSIKKFATSSGRAKKDDMNNAFIEDTGVVLNSIFNRDVEALPKAPVSDIVDSYYIALSQRIDNVQSNWQYEKGNSNAKKN